MKTITVKGLGKVTKSPDSIIINMKLLSFDKEYDLSMEKATKNLEEINSSLINIGFCKDMIKTTDFNVYTKYDNVRVENTYKYTFMGYECQQALKIQFDMDIKKLANVCSVISKCNAEPEITVHFTIKNPKELNEELLKSAATNASEKAKILCEATGVKLGDLVNIDYNWHDLNTYSNTNYHLEKRCLVASTMQNNIDITPDDIDFSEEVTFIWEIK